MPIGVEHFLRALFVGLLGMCPRDANRRRAPKGLPSGPPRHEVYALNHLLFDPEAAQQEGPAETFQIEAISYEFSPHKMRHRSPTHSGK